MTYGEFSALSLPKGLTPFRWSIFLYPTNGEDLESREIDLRAPGDVEDGTYDVFWLDEKPSVPGVVVRDRQFVPEPTIDAINTTVRSGLADLDGWAVGPSAPINHVYVERMIWTGDCFQVRMGS